MLYTALIPPLTQADALSRPVFCCDEAQPFSHQWKKMYNDPNHGIHNDIYLSFLAFAYRRWVTALDGLHLVATATATALNLTHSFPTMSPHQHLVPHNAHTAAEPSISPFQNLILAPPPPPLLTLSTLKNNPVPDRAPYIMHLTSRHDWGPVFTHRYFLAPPELEEDWIEISQVHWFAAPGNWGFPAEQWDLKCARDAKFYRLDLRPNLDLRTPPEDLEESLAEVERALKS